MTPMGMDFGMGGDPDQGAELTKKAGEAYEAFWDGETSTPHLSLNDDDFGKF